MGAVLYLKPIHVKFDTKVIGNYIKAIPGAFEAADQSNFYVLSNIKELDNFTFRCADISNLNHSAHAKPFIEHSEDEISIGVNWNDTSNNSARSFIKWLLGKYDCEAEDSDGYKYSDSQTCFNWVDSWLPK